MSIRRRTAVAALSVVTFNCISATLNPFTDHFDDFDYFDEVEDLVVPQDGYSFRYKNQHLQEKNTEYLKSHDVDLPIQLLRSYADFEKDFEQSNQNAKAKNGYSSFNSKDSKHSTRDLGPQLYKPPTPFTENQSSNNNGLSYARGLSSEWDNIAFRRSGTLTNQQGETLDLEDFNTGVSKSNQQSGKEKWDRNDPDYMWYDPYETESLFTDFTKYVTELHSQEHEKGDVVFNDNVYYSKKPWMVIFYAHWCGHCQSYVPQFKEFVRFLFKKENSWNAVLNIGTVNCGADKESKVCRQQLITTYPRIKYYRSWLSPSKDVSGDLRRGQLHTGSKSPNNLLVSTLKFLVENSEVQSKHNKGWRAYWKRKSGMPAPMLQLKKSTKVADKVLRNQYKKRSTRYVVVLYHTVPSSSQVVIMGLSNYRGITIFYKQHAKGRANYALIYEYCKPMRKLKFKTRDQMIQELSTLDGVALDVDMYDTSVREGAYPPKTPAQCKATNGGRPIVERPSVPDPVRPKPDPEPVVPTTTPEVIDEVDRETQRTPDAVVPDSEENNNKVVKPVRPPIRKPTRPSYDVTRVYPSNDHAEALGKILKLSIPLQILGDPSKRDKAVTFLQGIDKLSESLNLQQREIVPMKAALEYLESDQEFDEDVYDEIVTSHPTISQDWSDFCRGSNRGKRGFTCCLWRMFHTMTVHCAHDPTCEQMHDSIYAFITNFFACSNCVENFKMEYKKIPPPKKGSPNYNKQEVLWLWELHNDVNARLAGDITEDPEYPKQQVPLYMDCPACYYQEPTTGLNHTEIPWNKEEVFQYLMDYYRPYNMPKSTKPYQWPLGNYGFVKTKVGCPEGFSSWKRTQDTENNRPSNAFDGDWDRYISSYTGVTGLGTAMSWEFCMKKNTDYPTHDRLYFPRGNYCIVKAAGFACPANFTEGFLDWNDENDDNQNSYYGSIHAKPDGVFNDNTRIKFCCRKDGHYRSPISMPRDFSYTLFPHTVKECQRVKNKTNKRAWFLFDYEDDESFSNRVVHSKDSHPFVRNMPDGVRLYVCVYH